MTQGPPIAIQQISEGEKRQYVKDAYTVIVFSKNRPLQLFAFLESFLSLSNISQECINVLYKADDDYLFPMEQVKSYFPNINFFAEFGFKAQVLDLLENAKQHVIFFTDDDMLKAPVDLEYPGRLLGAVQEVFCFSLRLGLGLNHCYSVNRPQGLPKDGLERMLFGTKEALYIWDYKNKDWDWNYPLSVNGHVFRKHEILHVAKEAGDWKSPNTFEGNMSHFGPRLAHPKMASFVESKCVTIQHNKVQEEVLNLHAGGTTQELLDIWNQGKKIDISKFLGLQNKAAHVELGFEYITR